MPHLSPWLVTLLLAAPACAPSSLEGGFNDPTPPARLYAMEQVSRTQDRSSIPRLVEQLDSDDVAVRWVAIRSLDHLTGETLGFRPEDPRPARRQAIRRWVDAVRSGSLGAEAATNVDAESKP